MLVPFAYWISSTPYSIDLTKREVFRPERDDMFDGVEDLIQEVRNTSAVFFTRVGVAQRARNNK
jgi:hypothetical protein